MRLFILEARGVGNGEASEFRIWTGQSKAGGEDDADAGGDDAKFQNPGARKVPTFYEVCTEKCSSSPGTHSHQPFFFIFIIRNFKNINLHFF